MIRPNFEEAFFCKKDKRGITYCVLLMSLGVTNWPLLFKIMLDFTSRIFALKSFEYIECSGYV